MSEIKQIAKKLANAFMNVKLPKNFHPDAGITFTPEFNVEYMAKQGKPPMRHEPIGTNLFDVEMATELFEQIVPDAFADILKANSLLEARCKELESALREVDRQLEVGFVRCNTCGDQEDTKDFDCRNWIEEALSTPTTDEHLQKLFVEWLGEPVGWSNKADLDYLHKDNEVACVKLWKSEDTVDNLPLYAPKKVSE